MSLPLCRRLVALCLCVLLLAPGCAFKARAQEPLPPVTAVGGIITVQDGAALTIRAFTPAVTLTVDARGNAAAPQFTVLLTNMPANAVVSGAAVQAREVLDATAVRYTLSVPPRATATVTFTYVAPPAFSFVVMGDNRDGRAVYQRLIDSINAAQPAPAFVINGGDLVPAGRPLEYSEFLKDAESLHMPLYTALGNHDIVNDGRTLYHRLLAPDYYDFAYGPAHFIILDNADGSFGPTQLAWLKQTLSACQGQQIFLFMHKPLFDPRPGQSHTVKSAAEAAQVMSLAQQYHVRAVFASHIHMYAQTVVQGIPYIISGGAGAPLYAARSVGGAYHYVLVQVSGTGVNITPVPLP